MVTVKEFLTPLTLKASTMSDAESQGDLLEEKAPKSNITRGISVGQADKNLGRIKLPKRNGDKTKFENFWATFESVVDQTDEPAKYKMIRLKSCLEGKAEDAISRLGYSAEAYEEAKNTLKCSFGGKDGSFRTTWRKSRKFGHSKRETFRNLRSLLISL